jgi:hypothetical protein
MNETAAGPGMNRAGRRLDSSRGLYPGTIQVKT